MTKRKDRHESNVENLTDAVKQMERDNDEPNIWFDEPIGGMKKIEPVNGMRNHAPEISWGEVFNAWPADKQLWFAKRLASTMNHAADVLQQQSNEQQELIQKQEAELIELKKRILSQNDMVSHQLNRGNEQQQKLNEEIVKLAAENRELKKKLRVYEGPDGANS